MRFRDRLKNLCLIMVADTMADLGGIIAEIQAQSETTPACDRTRTGRSSVQVRPEGLRIGRADEGRGNPFRTPRATRALKDRAT
jgi:hypothetical protein